MELSFETRLITIAGQMFTAYVCPFCAGNASSTDLASLQRHVALHGSKIYERQMKVCDRCHTRRSISQFAGHGLYRVRICDECRAGRIVTKGAGTVRKGSCRLRGAAEKREGIKNRIYGRLP